jgi:hypothetical protein
MKKAILFSGGFLPKQDRERYRNNLAAFYSVLRHQYQYPKESIQIFRSGGGSFTDLHDGDVMYQEARRATLQTSLRWASSLQQDDQLLLVVSNHGDERGFSLWQDPPRYPNEPPFSPQELAASLRPITARKILIFGQCRAGMFGEELQTHPNTVTACACGPAESSYPTKSGDYDEYLYHLVGALGGQYPSGKSLRETLSASPSVSLATAHNYASRYAKGEPDDPATPLLYEQGSPAAQFFL